MWVVERPLYLSLFLLFPVLIYFRHYWRGRGGTLPFPFRVWGRAGYRGFATPTVVLLGIGTIAFWLGLATLLVALAGPERTVRIQSYLTRGIDIIIAIDQSPTMAAEDFQPDNRFGAAKSVVTEFVALRENDPVGLVGFGSEASLRVPPTLDYEHLLESLEAMQVWELGDGTAIGMGLAVSALHLERSDAPRRVIILITDGINNAGEIQPETAAEAARSLGIELYVVGIGSGEEVMLTLRHPETGVILRDTVSDSFDEDALRELAAAGGGRYFYAGSNTALEAVFEAIDSVERVEQRSLMRVERTPYHRQFILIGLALILVDAFIRRLLAREVLP
jgi:Ca-activated chloride channel family protein